MYLLITKKKEIKKTTANHQDYVDYLKKGNLCIPCKLYDYLNINSTVSNRMKFPLALTMINDTG